MSQHDFDEGARCRKCGYTAYEILDWVWREEKKLEGSGISGVSVAREAHDCARFAEIMERERKPPDYPGERFGHTVFDYPDEEVSQSVQLERGSFWLWDSARWLRGLDLQCAAREQRFLQREPLGEKKEKALQDLQGLADQELAKDREAMERRPMFAPGGRRIAGFSDGIPEHTGPPCPGCARKGGGHALDCDVFWRKIEGRDGECDCGGPPGHVPGGVRCRR